MTFLLAITELVILARERGDETHAAAANTVDDRAGAPPSASLPSSARQSCSRECARCGRGTKRMLCFACEADAPENVRRAFELATGLDGMREATDRVNAWARGARRRRAA